MGLLCKTLFERLSITFGEILLLKLDNIVMKLEKN